MKKTFPDIAVDGTPQFMAHGLIARRDVGIAAETIGTIERHALRSPGLLPTKHRIGILSNPRSHRNRVRPATLPFDRPGFDAMVRSPRKLPDLSRALLDFAEAGIELLVVDGGDGTVRDVLTCAYPIFGANMPLLAVVPSGKTNALALDLGLPTDWTIVDAIEAAQRGTVKTRRPVDILRGGSSDPDLRGFLFGAGAFVRATGLAQRTHKAGAVNGLAVGLSLAWGIAQTMFGGRDNEWRAGERMRIGVEGRPAMERDFYILFGSTLERLPLNVKPFGRVREGLKMLAVDAPPSWMPISVPMLLSGAGTDWLDRVGYHRGDPASFTLSLDGGFILDGELYAGGDMTVRQGEPLQFVTP